jgi:hypothetical protein
MNYSSRAGLTRASITLPNSLIDSDGLPGHAAARRPGNDEAD